jgi:AcrR family transcriptional regulator
MPALTSSTDARERVLDAAERLFAQRGYSAVTLRDIAAAVGIRHTSLYHHAPGGKEELFIEVSERNFKRHHDGLTQAMAHAEPDVRARLCAVADWLLSQPPMDLVRMMHSDMPSIDPAHADRLSWLAYESMLSPIEAALQHAQQRGEIEHHNLGLIAGGMLGLIESLYAVPQNALEQSRQAMAYELIDTLLNGLRSR